MCSLGHHDHAEDLPAPNAQPPRRRRRHLDGTFQAILKSMPRAVRNERRANVLADLMTTAADATMGAPFAPFEDGEAEQFELLPPGADHLPDHLITTPDDDDKRARRRGRSESFRATGDF